MQMESVRIIEASEEIALEASMLTLTQADYECELGILLSDFEEHWSAEDRKLRDWIQTCPLDEVAGFLDLIRPRLNYDV